MGPIFTGWLKRGSRKVFTFPTTFFALGTGGAYLPGATSYSSGSGTFVVPFGVTSLTIEGWGGGGGGGAGDSGGPFATNQGGNSGSGGGYFLKTLSVTAGQTITWFITGGVAAGDTVGGSGQGASGASVNVNSGAYQAGGGTGGFSNGSSSAVSGGVASGGDTNTSGANGGVHSGNDGAAGGNSGAGSGGGASSTAAANNATGPGGGGGGGAKNYAGGSGGTAGANGSDNFHLVRVCIVINGCQACGQFPNGSLGLPVRTGAKTAAVSVKPKYMVKVRSFSKYQPRTKRLPKV